jgi:hypothetical protein
MVNAEFLKRSYPLRVTSAAGGFHPLRANRLNILAMVGDALKRQLQVPERKPDSARSCATSLDVER